jgi:hypothetical protein
MAETRHDSVPVGLRGRASKPGFCVRLPRASRPASLRYARFEARWIDLDFGVGVSFGGLFLRLPSVPDQVGVEPSCWLRAGSVNGGDKMCQRAAR